MLYAYSSKRMNTMITHVVGFDQETLEKMEDHSHRFDGSGVKTINYNYHHLDVQIPSRASFVHLDENQYRDFIEKFDIHLVETKKELNFLEKIIE